MKEEVLMIIVDHPEDWIEQVSSLEFVKEAAPFGSALHAIVTDAPKAKALIIKLFEKEGIKSYSVEKIQPTLEDVFVSLIESYDSAGGLGESKKS